MRHNTSNVSLTLYHLIVVDQQQVFHERMRRHAGKTANCLVTVIRCIGFEPISMDKHPEAAFI